MKDWDSPRPSNGLLPDGYELAEFKPCVIEHPELGMVEYIHEDVPYVAHAAPHPEGLPGHYIDVHLAMDDKRLVGLSVWFLPSKARMKNGAPRDVP